MADVLMQRVGPVVGADGTPVPLRGTRDAALVGQDAHGRFYEAVSRGNVWTIATPLAGITVTANMLSSVAVTVIPARDRKSTRLNSSHGYISYAVFCLKKKTQTIIAAFRSRDLHRQLGALGVRLLHEPVRALTPPRVGRVVAAVPRCRRSPPSGLVLPL